MDRRTFVLLTGAASAALWNPLRRPRGAPRMAGTLRFDVDEQRRWSLWYHGGGEPVPVLRNATLGVWVGDNLVTLADLEDISVGNRRPPGGESLLLRGRTPVPAGASGGSVWVEAEFAAWDASSPTAADAHGAITVTVYPDRVLATIKGVRFCAAAEPQLLPGNGPLVSIVNGYHSWSSCQIATIPVDAASYAALGLGREGRGLGLLFDPGEAGEGKITLATDGSVEALSEWKPARPVRPEGDAATLRIAFTPDADSLAALAAAATPASSVDRERMAALATPAGWCSWYELGDAVTEADVLANLEFCAAHFDKRFLRYIQIDDGFQRSTGDWDANAKFPHGHKWLTDRIHATGFQAGLWIAPFAVSEKSGVPASNPAWLLKGADNAALVVDTRGEGWGGKIFALDGAHPEVQQWLYDLARRVVREWGYDYLKIDFLLWSTVGNAHYGGLTHAEAYRRGLTAIREGLGTEAFLLGCGAPLQHAAGLVNGMRIGSDVDASWSGIQEPARAAALRSFYHRAVWLNDPDCLVVRSPLTIDEARVWASVVAVSGGMTIFSDNLPKLPAERLDVLQKSIPVAPARGRPIDIAPEPKDTAPAIVMGDGRMRIPGPWRFRTGDDPRYAVREYDDDAWEIIPVPKRWEDAGHPDYDGSAWYRTRFTLPASHDSQGTPRLDLGKLDDNDETFINGVRVGATNGWSTFRSYPVPATALNWGGENVLAVHVVDTGGPGGFWSVRRDRPPAIWIVEAVPSWWTVVLVNWDDQPQSLAQNLATLGISAARASVYDVWADRPLADARQSLSASVAPHSALTLGIRPIATKPQIAGTTRHVVQGAIDISEEKWDARTRTLSAKSSQLDGRAYAVTIAVPKGLRLRTCKADVPCTTKRLESGHVVLQWPAGTTQDLNWSASFSRTSSR